VGWLLLFKFFGCGLPRCGKVFLELQKGIQAWFTTK
jgi:hypothetical protein